MPTPTTTTTTTTTPQHTQRALGLAGTDPQLAGKAAAQVIALRKELARFWQEHGPGFTLMWKGMVGRLRRGNGMLVCVSLSLAPCILHPLLSPPCSTPVRYNSLHPSFIMQA
jgi:hypothetical protein